MLFRGTMFCINYCLAFAATFFAMVILNWIGGLHASAAVLFILPLIAASMTEGQIFARRYRKRPSNQLCWRASLRMSAMVMLMFLAVLIPSIILQPGLRAELASIDAVGRAATYLLLFTAALGLVRLGYGFGLATELKGQQFSSR